MLPGAWASLPEFQTPTQGCLVHQGYCASLTFMLQKMASAPNTQLEELEWNRFGQNIIQAEAYHDSGVWNAKERKLWIYKAQSGGLFV